MINNSSEHTGMDAPKEIQADFKKEDFKPYMLNHYNEGCPTNSTCTKSMGLRYKEWSSTLSSTVGMKKGKEKDKEKARILESFRKEKGLPFEVWVTESEKHHPDLILWEGNCNYHNREGHKKIQLGVTFIKKLDDLNVLEKMGVLASRKLYHLNPATNKITRYRVPQNDTPLYMDGEEMIYQRSEDGIYYGISINPEGYISVVDTISPDEFPRSIPCPDLLNQAQGDHPEDFEKDIYAGVYCQQTWNKQTKSLDIILLGWSCD